MVPLNGLASAPVKATDLAFNRFHSASKYLNGAGKRKNSLLGF
jgi:hypothetical protein